MALRDKLLRERYRGNLFVKHRFFVNKIPASLSLAVEKMPYLSLAVNGSELTLTDRLWRDPCFRTADITSLVKVGQNEIVYQLDYFQRDFVYYVLYECEHAETLLTSLTYDTELAESYLFGDFATVTEADKFKNGDNHGVAYYGSFTIGKSRESVALTDVVKDGLPFFAGELRVGFDHVWKFGDPTVLKLKGRYSACEVYCQGRFAKTMLFDELCDLSDFLAEGNNRIELRLFNSNRNMLGPLHTATLEQHSVVPTSFTRENMWQDGKAQGYLNDRYGFVRFGLDCE